MAAKTIAVGEDELVACCGSTRFAQELAKASPFSSLEEAIAAARDVWFNKVDVNGCLQAFSAHPQIGQQTPSSSAHPTSAQLSSSSSSSSLSVISLFGILHFSS